MGMIFEDLPFPLGETWAQDSTPTSTDASWMPGKEYWVKTINIAASGIAKPDLTGKPKRVRIVRNTSAAVVLPKRLVKMKTDGTGYEMLSEGMAYATTVGELCYPADEFLPSAGAPINGLFYIVVEGLAKVTSGAAGDTTVAIGEYVIPTTDGKCIGQDTTVAAGAATFAQVQGAVGYAVTAVAAINTDFYINVTPR